MKKFIRIFALAALVAAFVSSCANNEDEDMDVIRELAFDQWMLENNPQATKTDYGVYVEYITKSEDEDAISPEEDYWVFLNYTGYLINDAVFMTRDSLIASNIGTFEYTTHFAPEYTYIDEDIMIEGLIYLLQDMKAGDHVKAYIPGTLGYTSSIPASFYSGYAGTSSVYTSAPIIFDLQLVGVVEDPEVYEQELVKEYALSNWGQAEEDYLVENLYLTKTDSLAGSVVATTDSVVYVYYKGYFLDGFVFDTNIEELAEELERYSYDNDYTPLECTLSSTELIDAFIQAFSDEDRTISFNDSFSIVSTSDYTYEDDGSSDGETIIQPYTPLVFDIQVLPYMGFEERPYTVYHILNNLLETDADPKEDIYVYGYVIGCVDGDTISESTVEMTEDNFTVSANLLIAPTSTVTDLENCIVVDLTTNPDLMDQYNLVDNPLRYGTRLTFLGDFGTVKGRIGVTNLQNYSL